MTRARSPRRAHRAEWTRCSLSFPYFLDTYGAIYDATARQWGPFRLWPAQIVTAQAFQAGRLLVVLKARQLGMTWLAVGYALWWLLFRPAATVLLFSRRDDEAVHLLRFRLRGLYDRLPPWMQARQIEVDNDHELRLSNGSGALAFPTTGGRSYTATLALVDEADHVPDLDRLLDAVKPTVDAGGTLILLSTADKAEPGSAFKRIYRAAREGQNGYAPIFLPWHARPDRTPAWYAEMAQDFLARDGTPDGLYGEYPAADVEALAGRVLDRRFAPAWLAACDGTRSVNGDEARVNGEFPGLALFVPPAAGRKYVIGADPAEGNPQSDESAASVVDAATGEQVAVLAGRLEPAVFAAALAQLSERYNGAGLLVERNNHGHAVLLWLAENGSGRSRWNGRPQGPPLRGLDGRPGWLSTGRGKPLAFDAAADALREGATCIRDRVTLDQLMAIRGGTLSAPTGEHDDRAVAHILALAALRWCRPAEGTGKSAIIPPKPVADPRETGGW